MIHRTRAWPLVVLLLLLPTSCDNDPWVPFIRTGPIDFSPAWSPDGRFLAFVHSPDETTGQPAAALMLYDFEADERVDLGVSGGGPSWTPDGGYLYYFVPWVLHLHRLELGTGIVTAISDGPHWDRYPAVSPDGRRIALSSTHSAIIDVLQLINPDGSERRKIFDNDTIGGTEWISWDPTGSLLAYHGYAGWEETIFITDTLGLERRPLATGAWPSWSPDGEWIAYSSRIGRQSWDGAIVLVRPDGSEQRVLISSAHPHIYMRPGHTTWSPDGEWLVFTARTLTSTDLWLIRRDGTGLKRLSPYPR